MEVGWDGSCTRTVYDSDDLVKISAHSGGILNHGSDDFLWVDDENRSNLHCEILAFSRYWNIVKAYRVR